MIYLNDVYKLLPKAKNISRLTKNNQSTNDIINQVLSQHKINVSQAKLIANLFDTGDAYGTCQNIWNFLKYQIPYEVEPSRNQTTKTLSRIIHDAKYNTGANDCKHYSGFTGAILDALGYNFTYRFAGYSNYLNVPTHVYVVCNDGKNKIFVDAVISGFDTEKPYKLKIDKKMSLYQLSGYEESEIGSARGRVKSAAQKVAAGAKKTAQKVAAGAKAVKQGTLALGLAIPRNAFLLLLRFNVNGWATGLSKMSFDQLKWWMQFGGNRTELMSAIKVGASKKRIFGIEDTDTLVGIGEPVTISAALASAAPIIAKVQSILKKAEDLSNKTEGIKGKLNKTKEAVDKANQKFKNITGKSVTDILFKKEAGMTGSKNSISPDDLSVPTDAQAAAVADKLLSPPKKAINNKMLLIGGSALVAAAIIFSKRK
jgi:hypothetical protein